MLDSDAGPTRFVRRSTRVETDDLRPDIGVARAASGE